MEAASAQDVEDFSTVADSLLVEKAQCLQKMELISKNCADANSEVLERNKWLVTLCGGTLTTLSQLKLPFPENSILLSSLGCAAGLLIFSHLAGLNKLNQEMLNYCEEYGNLELIHCNGVRLASGYLGVKPIFPDAKLIPHSLQLKLCKLLGGHISKTPIAKVVADSSALVAESPNGKFVIHHLGSSVTRTPRELRSYHGRGLTLFSLGSVVALAGVGLWGFFCFNAGNSGILNNLSGVKSTLPVWSLVRSLNVEGSLSKYFI